jgi:hypothetical protein
LHQGNRAAFKVDPHGAAPWEASYRKVTLTPIGRNIKALLPAGAQHHDRPRRRQVVKRCGKAGILCATIESRLAGTTATVFDSGVDCKDALRYLVKNAKQYDIDPTRIATFGGSAVHS